MKKYYLSASIMCADVLNMGSALKKIEDVGIDMLHCDILYRLKRELKS